MPEDTDVGLGNDAVRLNATVLYADLADSTALVDGYEDWFAAEIYKTFLLCAARLIRSEGGSITAYDGDRITGVYIGESKNTAAVRTAMKISCAVRDIINPARLRKYPDNKYVVHQVVGVDTSQLFVARTGVRGANDLVWVGRAANYAAKLAALNKGYDTYLTSEVFGVMHKDVKVSHDDRHMWTSLTWDEFDGRTIYGSTWQWNKFD